MPAAIRIGVEKYHGLFFLPPAAESTSAVASGDSVSPFDIALRTRPIVASSLSRSARSSAEVARARSTCGPQGSGLHPCRRQVQSIRSGSSSRVEESTRLAQAPVQALRLSNTHQPPLPCRLRVPCAARRYRPTCCQPACHRQSSLAGTAAAWPYRMTAETRRENDSPDHLAWPLRRRSGSPPAGPIATRAHACAP